MSGWGHWYGKLAGDIAKSLTCAVLTATFFFLTTVGLVVILVLR
jgi:hypothetical protein